MFGSFIATELRERHGTQFFGSGETFLFSLTPDPVVYRWTGETDLILRGNDQELLVGAGGGSVSVCVCVCVCVHAGSIDSRDYCSGSTGSLDFG